MSPILHLFSKQTQILLTYSAPNILIKCYYENSSASIQLILEKWPELGLFRTYFSNGYDTQCILPIDQLEKARAQFHELQRKFQRQSRIHLSIDDKIASFIVRNNPPEDFIVRYKREGDRFKRVLPGNVTEAKDGWLLRGFEFWCYPALSDAQLKLFQNDTIAQQDLLSYTKDYFPVFQRAGIRIESDIEYKNTPAIQLKLHSIGFDSIHILPQWNVAPETIDESIRIPGYIVSGRLLCSGILPSDIKQVLPDVQQDTELKQDAIAEFLDHWYIPWKPWIRGDFALFDCLHHWLKPPYHWILNVQSKLSDGIGKPFAYPIACIASERMTVQELLTAQERKYYHFSSGWVHQADLLSLGLNREGSYIGNVSAKPIKLDAEQMLYRGSKKLDVLWNGLKVDGTEWVVKADKHICANKHLEYLMYWGINGGITGGYEAFIAYGMPALIKKAEKYQYCCILVLGNQEDIEHMKKQYCDKPIIAKQFYFETYDRIVQQDELRGTKWDIEVFIEPENCFSNDSKKSCASRSSEFTSSCKLCFPYKFIEASEKKDCNEWIASMLDYKKKTGLAYYYIRDCREKKVLPDAYVFRGQLPEIELNRQIKALEEKKQKNIHRNIQSSKTVDTVQDGVQETNETSKPSAALSENTQPSVQTKEKQIGTASNAQLLKDQSRIDQRFEQAPFVQISMGDAEESHGVPIPPRKENAQISEPRSFYYDPVFQKELDFFEEARKLADYSVTNAERVPFFGYWPEYKNLNAQQRAWYFYLRSRIRSGQYPDTDLSYIFIHIYELV